MILDSILWVVIVISASIVAGIASRKFSVLSSINVRAIPAERHGAVKADLIEGRIKRRFRSLIDRTHKAAKPVGGVVSRWYERTYQRLRDMEEAYKRERSAPATSAEGTEESRTKVHQLLSEAEELLTKRETREAEARFIEAISIDPKNTDAFYGLGEVYLERKEYEHAQETFSFLVQLDENDDVAHHELGLVAKAMDKYDRAVEEFTRAAKISPNNPKYLNALVDIALLKGDKVLAWESFDKLRSANPENQKLEEIKKQIEALEQAGKPV